MSGANSGMRHKDSPILREKQKLLIDTPSAEGVTFRLKTCVLRTFDVRYHCHNAMFSVLISFLLTSHMTNVLEDT